MKRKGISLYGTAFTFLVVVGMLALNACSTNSHNNLGPVVHGVRYVSRDSSATGKVGPGQTIVVQGENLITTQKVTFDGYNAAINQTLFTDSTVIVTIPSDLPFGEVKQDSVNIIYVETKFGNTTFTFPILPPTPVINSVSNEFAHAGEDITIKGQYLYLIDEITFPGSVKATSYTSNSAGTVMQLTVPQGVTSGGAITIKTQSGTATSTPAYRFNDNTGVVCNFDDINSYSWGAAAVTSDAAQFPNGWGNYAQITGSNIANGDWAWYDGKRSVNLNSIELLNPSHLSEPVNSYALKFEIYVKAPWTTGTLLIRNGDNWDYVARYAPYDNTGGTFQTDGWQTVMIPLDVFKTKKDGVDGTGNPAASLSDLLGANGQTAIGFMYVNDGSTPLAELNIAFDNIRIVKITN